MGGQFTPYDPQRCAHYAHFTHDLDRIHFDALYWSLFIVVIGILFVASWIYQSTMRYRDTEDFDNLKYKRKLKMALAYSSTFFLLSSAMVVIEVFCLLALQFCDGEDLMSMYWATWTMLQMGAEIAILGIVLALWHQICDIRQPLWALALGTPVLVVAGFGHVITLSLEVIIKKMRAKKEERRKNRNGSASSEKAPASSATSIWAEGEQEPSRATSALLSTMSNEVIVLEINVGGHGAVVSNWPSFLRMENGRALIQANMRRSKVDIDLEAQAAQSQAGPSSNSSVPVSKAE